MDGVAEVLSAAVVSSGNEVKELLCAFSFDSWLMWGVYGKHITKVK